MSRIKPVECRCGSRPLGLSLIGLSVALGAGVAAASANAAAGLDAPAAAPVASSSVWCIAQPDGNRTCYDSLFKCFIADIGHDGSCTQQTVLDAPGATEVRQRPPAPPRRAAVPKHNHSLTAAQQEKLFRDFVKWTTRAKGSSH